MTTLRASLTLALGCALVACSSPSTRPSADATTLPAGVDATTQPPGVDTTTQDPGQTSCDFDHFLHPVGWACNRGGDCDGGLCQQYLDGDYNVVGYCTERCGGGNGCPQGFSCQSSDGEERCLADDPATLGPADGSLVAGEPCVTSADCAGGGRCALMGNLDGSSSSFCAPPCGPRGPSCGACGTCGNFGSLTEPTYLCAPRGPAPVGAACDSHFACSSFLCVGFCTQVCAASFPCPSGSECTSLTTDLSVCVTPERLHTGDAGSPCTFDLQCLTGFKCRVSASGTTGECRPPTAEGGACSLTSECAPGLRCLPGDTDSARTCRPPSAIGGVCLGDDANCASGLTCRDLGPDLTACTKDCSAGSDCGADGVCGIVELDSHLRLFATIADAKAGRPLADNDNSPLGDGDLFSHLAPMALAPGTYFVAVDTYQAYLGAYELRIAVGGATPSPEFELPENPFRRDTPEDAQPLFGFPVTVAGTIDTADDVDFFTFTVPPGGSVAVGLEVGRGNGSACFAEARVARGAIGDACEHGAYCMTGSCNYTLGRCSMACTDDTSCGAEGLSCVPLGAQHGCVPTALVGATGRDETCRVDIECAEGVCVSFGGRSFCSARCVGSGVDCGPAHECAAITEIRDGIATRTATCLPDGDRRTGFNFACVRHSDCLEGMACVGGRCSTACEHDLDCPAQTFPPAPTTGRFDCAPCKTSLDCGDGYCLTGVGYERYCADTCGANDTCPAGFHCDDAWGKLCVPDHGSCRRPTCSLSSGGRCVVPASDYAEACGEAGDCTTGRCEDALCTKGCGTSADCGCAAGDLVCEAGRCVVSPTYVNESEPNDKAANAMVAAVPSTVMGLFDAADGRRDADAYRLTLTAGTTLDVVTRPVCGTGALRLDPAMRLTKDGVVVAEDDSSDWYGSLSHAVTNSGEYVLTVRDDGWGMATPGRYVLELKVR
ncbi:MAG: hypothetical protein RL199_136 [Pseudomonadota bacterium]|jgi:hypothetical protein